MAVVGGEVGWVRRWVRNRDDKMQHICAWTKHTSLGGAESSIVVIFFKATWHHG
jgi:hypothetical protein